jgi:hypothetical protein
LTLFPETFDYILAAFAGRKPDGIGLLGDLVPVLKAPETLENSFVSSHECLRLCIFEDSSVDMGLVNSVEKNFFYILELLEDYLAWVLENPDENSRFLRFGAETLPDAINIDDTLVLLGQLLTGRGNTTLRERRNAFVPIQSITLSGTDGESLKNRYCDFCGKPISGGRYERLSDGRERCTDCRNYQTDGVIAYTGVLDTARQWLTSSYQIKLRRNFDVHVTDAKQIHTVIGEEFIPTSHFDARTIGLASCDGKDNCTVHIENGHPYANSLATMVHELTHVWQFDNLDYSRMKSERGLLLTEGHAVFSEIHCLRANGLAEDYCQTTANRKDVYGQGYREVERMLEEAGERNPFRLLEKAISQEMNPAHQPSQLQLHRFMDNYLTLKAIYLLLPIVGVIGLINPTCPGYPFFYESRQPNGLKVVTP